MSKLQPWALWIAMATSLAACPRGALSTGDAGTLLHPGQADSGASGTGVDGGCLACVQSAECPPGSLCVQLQGNDVCVKQCLSDDTCENEQTCLAAVALDGTATHVCVSSNGVCGGRACFDSCVTGTSCDLITGHCLAALDAGTVDAGPATDAGGRGDAGSIDGTVGISGGTVNRLFFAVVGDTRPSLPNDTARYPTAVISGIFQAIQDMSPRPQFVIGTGDYQYALPTGVEGSKQVSLYMAARNLYAGPFFPAMGNHECTGYAGSNCASLATSLYTAFTASMLQPLGQSKPYYSFDVRGENSAWTAKFVVTACNAWDATQKNWLAQQLARETTYTFIVRHMPLNVAGPCIGEMEPMLATSSYTMFLAGHVHTFSHNGRELIEGTGGAPITGNATYGYATVEQLADGALQVTQYDSGARKAVAVYMLP